jgi:hypothetical protein
MKNSIALLFLALMFATSATAQSRVHPKELRGTTWQVRFDLNKEADNAFERIAMKMAEGLMDEIKIEFEFMKDDRMRIHVEAFGEEDDEDEYTDWSVNEEGQLLIGDSESFEYDDTVFMRDGDRLIALEYERGKLVEKEELYLVRVDR